MGNTKVRNSTHNFFNLLTPQEDNGHVYTEALIDKHIPSNHNTPFTRFLYKLLYHVVNKIAMLISVLILASSIMVMAGYFMFRRSIEPGILYGILSIILIIYEVFLVGIFFWNPYYREIFGARECMCCTETTDESNPEDTNNNLGVTSKSERG